MADDTREPSNDEADSGTLNRLRAREALLSEAERIVQVGSFVWEPGVSTLWSDEFYRILGCEPGSVEPSSESFFVAVHPDDLATVRAARASAGKRGIVPELEFRVIRRDGGGIRHIRASGCVYRHPDGRVQRIVGALHDITPSKRAALALEQALAVSRAAEELAHMGSFVAHLHPFEITLSEGLRKLTGVLAHIDARHVEQMLANLIVNAADAIEASGRALGEVRIVTDQLQLRAACESVPDTVPAGHYTRIRVEDDGGGVAPEFLPRIFEPYFTTKPHGRGTGLGLSAVYGMAHQNGGVVTVEALPAGTRFALWFPVPAQQLKAAANAIAKPVLPVRRVLVVDDIPELCFTTAMTLRDAGFEAYEAHSADAALAALAFQSVDLVLSDIQMPGRDGYALASELQRSYPGAAHRTDDRLHECRTNQRASCASQAVQRGGTDRVAAGGATG